MIHDYRGGRRRGGRRDGRRGGRSGQIEIPRAYCE